MSNIQKPTVGITSSPLTLIEDQGTVTTVRITLNQAPPPGGLIVKINSTKSYALGDFDIGRARISNAQIVRVNDTYSGFDLKVTGRTASIAVPVYNDTDLRPTHPNWTRNDDIGLERTSFSLLSSPSYQINNSARVVNFTIVDTASQLRSAQSSALRTFSQDTLIGTVEYPDDDLIRGRGSLNSIKKVEDKTSSFNPIIKTISEEKVGVIQFQPQNDNSLLVDQGIMGIIPESAFI